MIFKEWQKLFALGSIGCNPALAFSVPKNLIYYAFCYHPTTKSPETSEALCCGAQLELLLPSLSQTKYPLSLKFPDTLYLNFCSSDFVSFLELYWWTKWSFEDFTHIFSRLKMCLLKFCLKRVHLGAAKEIDAEILCVPSETNRAPENSFRLHWHLCK